jgi:broad specificity phosphatase PhoE
MELLLVRHGEASHNSLENYNAAFNCPDPELTEVGKDHARQLGMRLRDIPIQRIYASDLMRAMRTAQILAEFIPAPLEVRGELREINMGRLFLSTWEEIERDMPGYATRWHRHDSDMPYPDGESGADVIHRCMPLIDEIVQSGMERAVIVTHGGTIRSLLCAFLGIGLEKRFLFGAPLANCGLTSIRWDAKRHSFLVHSVNEMEHLG